MSQSDNSLFFILIRSLFLITTFGFGVCLVHFFYQSVSKIKVVYNFSGKVVASDKKLSLLVIMVVFPGEVAPDMFPVGDPDTDMFLIFLFYLCYLFASLTPWFYDELMDMWYNGATISEIISLLRELISELTDLVFKDIIGLLQSIIEMLLRIGTTFEELIALLRAIFGS